MKARFLAYRTIALVTAALAVSCASGERRISGLEAQSSGGNALDSPAAAERHGCCSDHGGACGCSKNKVQCCDGSFSRNCSCE